MEKPFEESWFYAPLRQAGDRAVLSAEESRHVRKVLRIRNGRRVVASNGTGGVFLCETAGGDESGSNGDPVAFVALERITSEKPPRLHMVLSLLKGKDLEEPVEGLCQLPITSIHLVTTDHTQEFKGQEHGKLVERLRAKSLVALKQAKKSWLTEIHAPVPLAEWKRRHAEMDLLLLHPGPSELPQAPARDFAVLTGPEGGFSQAELQWLKAQGRFTLGLGETRIRATHAPLLACGKLMGLGWI